MAWAIVNSLNVSSESWEGEIFVFGLISALGMGRLKISFLRFLLYLSKSIVVEEAYCGGVIGGCGMWMWMCR